MNVKTHNQDIFAATLRERRRANKKRSLSTFVYRVTESAAARKQVTSSLRTNAKKLRESGELGKVQTRTGYVTETVVGKKYRYTAAQVAMIAKLYKPRKDEYKAVRAALVG